MGGWESHTLCVRHQKCWSGSTCCRVVSLCLLTDSTVLVRQCYECYRDSPNLSLSERKISKTSESMLGRTDGQPDHRVS